MATPLFAAPILLADGALQEAHSSSRDMVVDPVTHGRPGLKRALVGVSKLTPNADNRRRLSASEREALVRELREAMDGIYETRRTGPSLDR